MRKMAESFHKIKKPKASIVAKRKKPEKEGMPKSDEKKDSKKRKEKEKEKERKTTKETEVDADEPTEEKENADDIEDAKGVPVPKFFQSKTENQQLAFEKFAKQMFATGVDGLLKEYNEQLKNYIGQPAARAIFDKNGPKNRYKDVICNDLTRVEIKDGKPSDYIHANFVRGEPLFNEYVCTQGPTATTRDDFWRMIVFLKVERIAMLCETVEAGKTKCDQYWPMAKGEKMTFGDIVVENITTLAMARSNSITTTKLNVTQKSSSFTVFHHHWKTWPDRSIPKSTKDVLRVLRAIRFSGKPAVIHCSAGIGRTGTLVAIEMAIQAILTNGSLSLIAICKRLRDQRMGVLQVDVQFVYMALAVIDFGMSMGFLGKDFSKSPFKRDFYLFKKNLDAVVAIRMQEASNPPPAPTAGKGSNDTCTPEKPEKPLGAVGSDDQMKAANRTQDKDEKTKEHMTK